MRILITGGFGFIGGRLGQRLMGDGHQVILGTRSPTVALPEWLPNAEVCLTRWDDTASLEKLCEHVDVVIHAAGMNANECEKNPAAALEFNGLGTARIFQAAEKVGVKKFVYLSTAHVYASPLTGTINESTCTNNLHPYATSHLAGENAVLRSVGRGRIKSLVLRLSNVYGAPATIFADCWTLLVNDLCRQAVEHGKMHLRSSGEQQRDFITMTEICKTLSSLSICPDEQLNCNVFNIGSGQSFSILEMAKLIQLRCINVLGIEPQLQITTLENKMSAPTELKFEISKLSSLHLSIDPDPIQEIDRLLVFCDRSFRKPIK